MIKNYQSIAIRLDQAEALLEDLYKTRQLAKDARKEWVDAAIKAGPCLRLTDDSPTQCYHVRNLVQDDWCDACKAKQPFWKKYRTLSVKAGVQLRAVLAEGKRLAT